MLETINNYHNITFIDINKIISVNGAENFFDDKGLYSSNSRYSKMGYNVLAFETEKYINMIYNTAKKCLVLDCDNVLWGGLISEDGIENITLSKTFNGRAFRDFQREVVKLKNQGIIICLCSKNDEHDIWNVFEKHTDMLLKKDDISAYRINFNNKADNIREIAEELNISISDIVFIDDSEYECKLVKSFMSEITVIRLNPDKIHTYVETLRSCNYFNVLSITTEDKNRNGYYNAQAQRKYIEKEYHNIDEFNKQLQTMISIDYADSFSIPRIAELSQRSNQFNLSTKRYTKQDIQEFISDMDHDVIKMEVSDIFGNMGLVGAAIVEYRENEEIILDFFLSCRAFGRNFENNFLDYLLKEAKKRGIPNVFGVYKQTDKNVKQKDFYIKNGVKFKDDK